jgi:histidyl-tRNA synthetase
MALSKKPVTGMKDILPKEMEIRDYCIRVIKETYGLYGFTSIETPCVESIGNLSSKQGGDNEKLIFKILKRGEKLHVKEAETEEEIVDGGLRYDLTVPLVRYYSNHVGQLTTPFKSLQMGNVWRAERPQRGRFRQFMQCDIDILGESSNLAEIELIQATTTVLGKLDFRNFQIRINDRRILKAMAAYSGFQEKDFDSVFITLDKADKIGWEGVSAELLENGFSKEAVETYLKLFEKIEQADDPISCLEDILRFQGEDLGVYTTVEKSYDELLSEKSRTPDKVSPEVSRNDKGVLSDTSENKKKSGTMSAIDNFDTVLTSFREIIDGVKATRNAEFTILFDPTLVRGMSYYTGTIFEVAMPEYGGSCGGGGRYDAMVERFTGQEVPACGFSIGFERIIMLLMENGFQIPGKPERSVYLIEKGVSGEALTKILKQAAEERASGKQILVERMMKNKKFQKEQLRQEGYEEFREFYKQ